MLQLWWKLRSLPCPHGWMDRMQTLGKMDKKNLFVVALLNAEGSGQILQVPS